LVKITIMVIWAFNKDNQDYNLKHLKKQDIINKTLKYIQETITNQYLDKILSFQMKQIIENLIFKHIKGVYLQTIEFCHNQYNKDQSQAILVYLRHNKEMTNLLQVLVKVVYDVLLFYVILLYECNLMNQFAASIGADQNFWYLSSFLFKISSIGPKILLNAFR
jgi:hypothetical protein